MELPQELLWGVDIAIKKLRPFASFQLTGTQFTGWFDPTSSGPPTWDEVMAQVEKDRLAAEEWQRNN